MAGSALLQEIGLVGWFRLPLCWRIVVLGDYVALSHRHVPAATVQRALAHLVREHWSLVFKDPGSAKRTAYEQGKFKSCDTTTALNRLTGIVGLPITAKEREAIDDLTETRNALTH